MIVQKIIVLRPKSSTANIRRGAGVRGMCSPSENGSVASPTMEIYVGHYVRTKQVFIVPYMIIVTNRSIIPRCIFGHPIQLIVHRVIVGQPIRIMYMTVVRIMPGILSTSSVHVVTEIMVREAVRIHKNVVRQRRIIQLTVHTVHPHSESVAWVPNIAVRVGTAALAMDFAPIRRTVVIRSGIVSPPTTPSALCSPDTPMIMTVRFIVRVIRIGITFV